MLIGADFDGLSSTQVTFNIIHWFGRPTMPTGRQATKKNQPGCYRDG